MQNKKDHFKNGMVCSWASSYACSNLLEIFQSIADFPNTTACSVCTDGKSHLLTGLEPLRNSTTCFAMTAIPSEELKAPYQY